MALSTIAAAGFRPAASPVSASHGTHRHGGQRVQSLSDADTQGSSLASAPSSTGKIGSKVNVTA